ncbi:MAG TPA: histidine kinase [Anaerolineae bacterium]|nr:histidine kinase [Anaerolineae bacterium]
MNSFQIFLNSYSFISVTLSIVGIAGVSYLVAFARKTAATWYLIGALSCIPMAMLGLFVNASVAPWGGAFWFTPDMFAILSMTAMLHFIYHMPDKDDSRTARVAAVSSVSLSGIALGVNALFVYYTLTNRSFVILNPARVSFLMPLAFVTTLVAALHRTIRVQQHIVSAMPPHRARAAVWAALMRPQGPARILRNYSLALSLGLFQGIAAFLSVQGWLPTPWSIYGIGLSLLLMATAILYTTLEYTIPHTGLSLKLIGLSLTVILIVLGGVGLLDIHAALRQGERERELQVEIVRRALPDLRPALPEAVAYVVAWDSDGVPARWWYARQPDFDLEALGVEEVARRAGAPCPAPMWNYATETTFADHRYARSVRLRYAGNLPGSYYRYVGYIFNEEGLEYEVGFNLAEADRPVHETTRVMILVVLGSSVFIIVGLPWLLQRILIQPLHHLLAGVRQINAGQLEIAVPVRYEDEIGFLTQTFNQMAASLHAEIGERQRAEAQITALNLTLEQQILDRTRDLSALYAVSAIAGQSVDADALLQKSLAQTVATMQAEAGLIALGRESAAPTLVALAAPDFPPAMVARLRAWFAAPAVLAWALASPAAILIPDAADDARLPVPLSGKYPLTLLMIPMRNGEETWGAICLARRVGHTFNVEEVALLASIADQLGLALQSDRLRQQATVLEERQRIGRDLHDAITQSLYGLVTLTEAGQLQLETGATAALSGTLSAIGQAARQVLKELRLFIYQLRPLELEQEGLVSAIHQRLSAVEGRATIRARLLADEGLHLPPPVEAALYQITREALNNTLRHARADAVTVTLRQDGAAVWLEIVDDGCGFDRAALPPGGMGLLNMRARAQEIGGELEIVTQPGQGTRIKVVIQERTLLTDGSPAVG